MQETLDSPWAVLGLGEGATLAEVRSAFRARAKAAHPDHGGSRAEFEALRAAFEAARRLAPTEPRPGRRNDPEPVPAAEVPERRVPPVPPRVVRAYAWPACAAAPAGAPRRRTRRASSRSTAAAGGPPRAFAAVLHDELVRLGIPA